MFWAALLTGAITYAIVYLEKYGQRIIELIIIVLVSIICIAYAIELFLAKPDWSQVAISTFVATVANNEAVYIAVGIVGATVMPHVIYLHSSLVQHRVCSDKHRHLKLEKIDIAIAMNIAFVVNAAMLVVSAAVFYKRGIEVTTIQQANETLVPLLGNLSSGAFGIALLAAGLSSSAVGTMAGQTVMKGFVGLNIPLNIRRLITLIPALVIIGTGVNPMKALIFSQVLLSFALPLAIVPLLIICNNEKVMGDMVNKKATKVFGALIAIVIVGLNVILVFQSF